MKKNNNKLTTKILHKFAKKLMFNLSEKQCKNLLLEFKAIEKQIKIIKMINTDNIKPLNYPFSKINIFLRSDNIINNLYYKNILNISPEIENFYISVNRVNINEN